MSPNKYTGYFFPLLLAVMIFISNFIDTNIFSVGENNFAIWFVISFLAFGFGWLINKKFDWNTGVNVFISLTIATTVLSVLVVVFFKEYFSSSEFVVENIFLYSLRNILLGATGYFGMAVAEIYKVKKDYEIIKAKLQAYQETIGSSKKEAEILLREAQVKALQIITEAESISKNTILKKERIERELREFIQIEKELIKKYEE
jgi:hypothetical protein